MSSPTKSVSEVTCLRFPAVAEHVSPIAVKRLESGPKPGFMRVQIRYGIRIYQLFDISSKATFGRPMKKFAEKINQELAYLRFHYSGSRVEETDSPASLKMDEDVNVIDVNLMQTGG
ncbi:hypothetical protein B0H11DRAFT_2226975 [Mycena galericulata]|nr:hypothetical protein B0H11DRAFT_2226975 [Mycena galericulata]